MVGCWWLRKYTSAIRLWLGCDLKVRYGLYVLLGVVIIIIVCLVITLYNQKTEVGVPLNVTMVRACTGNGECQDQVALLDGEIKANSASVTFDQLLKIAIIHPTVKTACFRSAGGDIKAAVALAKLIHEGGFSTCIANEYKLQDDSVLKGFCQSSCVWVLASGKETILYDGSALLGFHAARKVNMLGFDSGIDCNALVEFEGIIKLSAGGGERFRRLSELLRWSFDQGAGKATVDCSAQQVDQYYPFFTSVKDSSSSGRPRCVLKSSNEGLSCH